MFISCLTLPGFAMLAQIVLSYMVFLPKKPSGKTFEGMSFYTAAATRPLSLGNTFVKLIATTLRIAMCRVVVPKLHPAQRCLIGKNILDNVINLDSVAHILACQFPNAAMVFLDFWAAFPSVAHSYMWNLLEYMGLPKKLIQILKGLYKRNRHIIKIDGAKYKGPTLLSGVRTGCPLSMLLFAICIEPLLRKLSSYIAPHEALGAFADDVGLVLANVFQSLPMVLAIFNAFGACSNLRLNLAKTWLVPLWDVVSWEETIASIIECCADAKGLQVAHQAVYLGFCLGPLGPFHLWCEVIRKAADVLVCWKNLHAGIFYSIIAHNVYIAPIFGYIGQLFVPDASVKVFVDKIRASLFVGPGNWISQELVTSLKEIGFPISLRDIEKEARASQFRVFHQTALNISSIATEVGLAIIAHGNNGGSHVMMEWHSFAIAPNLLKNDGELGKLRIGQVPKIAARMKITPLRHRTLNNCF